MSKRIVSKKEFLDELYREKEKDDIIKWVEEFTDEHHFIIYSNGMTFVGKNNN
jgi:hypothetical protein